MNMISTSKAPLIVIQGRSCTEEQILAAFAACRQLELAYAKASEDNGGSSSVDWEDVDQARELATLALSPEELEAIADSCAGVQPEYVLNEPGQDLIATLKAARASDAPMSPNHPDIQVLADPGMRAVIDEWLQRDALMPFEFKRSEDTEGGTPD
jgi:hypothetical protein